MEAETIALSEAASTVMFCRRLLSDLGHPQHVPTTIHVDNQSTIAYTKGIMCRWRNRHIPIRDLRIRDLVVDKTIDLEYISTMENHADLFTKALPLEPFTLHRDALTTTIMHEL